MPNKSKRAERQRRKREAWYGFVENPYQSPLPYRIVISYPVYDGRDAIRGYRSDTFATAFTLGWARVLWARENGDCPDGIGVDIWHKDGRQIHPYAVVTNTNYVPLSDSDIPF